MKLLNMLIIMMLSVSFGICSNPVDNSSLYGYWGNTENDETGIQHYICYFYNNSGKLSCEFHSYRNGMKFESEPAVNITFDGKHLSMIANQSADVKFEGELDSNQNVIVGRLIYSNGTGRKFNLTKISREKISEEFPGLLHLKETEYSYSQPVDYNDGLPTSSLKELNIDENLLNEMMVKIIKGEYGRVNSILLLRNGKLVFEKYFDGFYTDDLHVLRSATKSISSLLIGIARDQGLINSVDQKVSEFYPEYKNMLDDNWNKVLLKHILTMTAGLNWEMEDLDNIWQKSSDVIKSTFERKFRFEPGEKFEYQSPNIDLLAGVITTTAVISVQQFAEKNLFKPLGITKYYWPNFKKNSYPLMDGSLCLSPRDMAKIGLLVLGNGKWENKQIISKKWITESTSIKVNVDEFFDYGYLWWIGKSRSKPGLKVVFANGLGGQHILVIPELSAVIVTTGANFNKPAAFLLRMIDDYLIKSIN